LNKRLTEWGVPRRKKPSPHASAASTPCTNFSTSTLTQSATTPSNAFANRPHPWSEVSPISPALPSSKKCAPLCPTHMGGNTAGVATGIDASMHHPVDGVEHLATINSGDDGMFTIGSTQIINRWDDNQFQDVNSSSFCTQLPPLEG
jgi:pyruvate/2-oxoacid:ferredoxin oxidoreductase beta subunit